MDAASIKAIEASQAQAKWLKIRAEESQQDIVELQLKLEHTEEALLRCRRACDLFRADMSGTLQAIRQLRSLQTVNAAHAFAGALAEEAEGAKARQAESAFEELSASLRQEMERLEDEIQAKRTQVVAMQGQIDLLFRQIAAAKAS